MRRGGVVKRCAEGEDRGETATKSHPKTDWRLEQFREGCSESRHGGEQRRDVKRFKRAQNLGTPQPSTIIRRAKPIRSPM